jgi:hypothetical protein
MNFDINRIEQILKTENLYSDTLGSKSPEAMKDSLAAKVESQKWCLGIDTELKYYTDVAGALQRILSTGKYGKAPTVNHDAPESPDVEGGFESVDAAKGKVSRSVVEEAIFMRNLGNMLKEKFPGLTFQQFAEPPRRMRGAGGSGWSLHNGGEAIDLFYKDNKKLTDYLVQNAAALNLKIIIDYHNQRIWNSRRNAWRTSSSVETSYKHIHVDRGGYTKKGQGLSPEQVQASNVRKLVEGD